MRISGVSMRMRPVETMERVTAGGSTSSHRAEVERLRADTNRLLMMVEALWEILREQHGYTDDELLRRVTLIDLRSGKLDGKPAKAKPGKCEHCGRTLDSKRPTCMYCGRPVRRTLFPT